MRGLKLFVSWNAYLCGMVASFTDAWIETNRINFVFIPFLSHLLQMRGLKLFDCITNIATNLSHLLQMRGLKPSKDRLAKNFTVASFTDAWIETQSYSLNLPPLESHLLQMRGLKHPGGMKT